MVTIGKLSEAKPADILALWVKLAGNCAARHVSPILFRAVAGRQSFAAFSDGQLVGLRVATVEKRGELFVHFLGVDPGFKGLGVSRMLSQAAHESAAAGGFRSFRARVDLLNADLVSLMIGRLGYQARGFVNGNPHDAMMTFRIPPAPAPGGDAVRGHSPDSSPLLAMADAPFGGVGIAGIDVAGDRTDVELPAPLPSVIVELPATATYPEMFAALQPAFLAGLAIVGFVATDDTYIYSLGVVDA